MPKSKTRKNQRVHPRPTIPEPVSLESATLKLTKASMELVREAEVAIKRAARTGDLDRLNEAITIHHYLRTGALGLLVAYSQLADLPDPRNAEILTQGITVTEES